MSSDPGFKLGENLEHIMQERGMSMRQLAQTAGLSESGVQYIRNGKITNPGCYTVYRLALVLRVPMEDLMGVSRIVSRARVRAYSGASLAEILEENSEAALDSPSNDETPGDNPAT